ncbi:hypothetical protein D9758_014726 [Tetrapyrgos nigripes]|uniref:Uncharacterized protein n=1 Tax=Tetrapyrgos nigripes TaxID=182062 RepID=A0A8H5CCD2_9AGAR|nr:hypothetical protein D9758_014726 [Tetrapyrgos nigripes]
MPIPRQKLYSPISDSPPPTRIYPQPAPIIDFIWYPTATPRDSSSFCFVSSVRECPVKLLDASDGRVREFICAVHAAAPAFAFLRASYPIIDHRERFIAPHSLAFNLTGQSDIVSAYDTCRLYCGFEDAIEVFNVGQPGEGTRLATTPSKKSKDGLKGIISSLAFSPSYESELFAAGSLTPTNGNIALFNESQGTTPLMYVEGGPEIASGVIQLQFNPVQPHMLYASFRRRNEIYSWDLRSTTAIPVQIFDPELPAVAPVADTEQGPTETPPVPSDEEAKSQAKILTHQKRRFDVDISGKWLGIGNQEGVISIFDTSASDGSYSYDESSESHSMSTSHIPPALKWVAAKDSIGSVSFNPLSPLLLAVAGSRHFDNMVIQSGSSDSDETDDTEDEDGDGGGSRYRYRYRAEKRQPMVRDSSVKLWKF